MFINQQGGIQIGEVQSKYVSVYHELEELVGKDNTLKIYESFKGQDISFPQRLYRVEYVEAYVKKHYDGKNLRELAKKFGYTERSIRRLLHKADER